MKKYICSSVLAAMTLTVLQAPLRADSFLDTSALQAAVTVSEQKIAGIQDSAVRGDLETALASFKNTTARLKEKAASIDAQLQILVAREAFLNSEYETRTAAKDQFEVYRKQAMSDINRWCEAREQAVAVRNANVPTFTLPEQQAAFDADTTENDRQNAEAELKFEERRQLWEKLKAESAPFHDARIETWDKLEKLKIEKQNTTAAIYTDVKVWQDQLVWLNAAVEVAASGSNPASALTPFPLGGPAPAAADLTARGPASVGTNVDAAAQLKSVEQHSVAAAQSGSKEEAGKGFDAEGTENGSLVYAGQTSGRPTPVFVANLPQNAQKDTQIQQSVAYYQKLESLKVDTARKIEAVKEEQKSGKGDAAVLAAHLGTLTNDLNRQESDQTQAKAAVEKRVKDLGFDWNESAIPAAKPAE